MKIVYRGASEKFHAVGLWDLSAATPFSIATAVGWGPWSRRKRAFISECNIKKWIVVFRFSCEARVSSFVLREIAKLQTVLSMSSQRADAPLNARLWLFLWNKYHSGGILPILKRARLVPKSGSSAFADSISAALSKYLANAWATRTETEQMSTRLIKNRGKLMSRTWEALDKRP